LLELGILDRFSQKSSEAPSTTQTVTQGNHPTHWILALLYLGKTKPKDNGYLVICLPKSKSTPQMVAILAEKLLKNRGTIAGFKALPGDSSDN